MYFLISCFFLFKIWWSDTLTLRFQLNEIPVKCYLDRIRGTRASSPHIDFLTFLIQNEPNNPKHLNLQVVDRWFLIESFGFFRKCCKLKILGEEELKRRFENIQFTYSIWDFIYKFWRLLYPFWRVVFGYDHMGTTPESRLNPHLGNFFEMVVNVLCFKIAESVFWGNFQLGSPGVPLQRTKTSIWVIAFCSLNPILRLVFE